MGWTKLVEDDGTEIGTTGDSVWDLCDNFVQDLKQIYRKEIGREINKEEIKEVLHDLDMEFNIVVFINYFTTNRIIVSYHFSVILIEQYLMNPNGFISL